MLYVYTKIHNLSTLHLLTHTRYKHTVFRVAAANTRQDYYFTKYALVTKRSYRSYMVMPCRHLLLVCDALQVEHIKAPLGLIGQSFLYIIRQWGSSVVEHGHLSWTHCNI
jgi:hypothetical protein